MPSEKARLFENALGQPGVGPERLGWIGTTTHSKVDDLVSLLPAGGRKLPVEYADLISEEACLG